MKSKIMKSQSQVGPMSKTSIYQRQKLYTGIRSGIPMSNEFLQVVMNFSSFLP